MWSNDSPPANRRHFIERNKDVQDPFRNIYFVKDTVSPWVLVFFVVYCNAARSIRFI